MADKHEPADEHLAAEKHVVVDGSNLATEGRTNPSLEQLNDAVIAFLKKHPHEKLTVVVDATFGHRIDAHEKPLFEEAILAGELVSPPAGAIGRGDAFVLQIADQAHATVLSNDSFQEFHGEYDWLFDEGRLVGGKPVPAVGWVFVNRTPVRGPTSRRATRETRGRSRRGSSKRSANVPTGPPPVPKTPPPGRRPLKAARRGGAEAQTASAATADVVPADTSPGRRARGARGGRKPEPINEPMAFIEFVGAHPVGSTLEAEVERFSSHGAYVKVGDARAYVPLKSMADPAPRSAREVLEMGATRTFVVQAIDTPRRSIDLALPGFAQVEDPHPPTDDIPDQPDAEEAPTMAAPARSTRKAPARKKAATKKAPARKTNKKATARKTTAKKAPAKRTTAKKAATKKTTARKAPAKKATARKAPAKRATAKKAPAKKATAARKTTAKKKTAARKTTAKKATARKAPAKKRSTGR
ncbi:hypothetical protein BH20ACT2_BH20ACT2_08070 [soil metagenome]